MIVWVMFVFHVGGGLPSTGMFTYATKAECEVRAADFKRAACVRVRVEVPQRSP